MSLTWPLSFSLEQSSMKTYRTNMISKESEGVSLQDDITHIHIYVVNFQISVIKKV